MHAGTRVVAQQAERMFNRRVCKWICVHVLAAHALQGADPNTGTVASLVISLVAVASAVLVV